MIPGVRPQNRPRTPRVQHPRQAYHAVRWSEKDPWAEVSRRPRGAKKEGLLFEAEVSEVLSQVEPPWFYLPGMWISYRDLEGAERHAQPDGLLVNFREGMVVVCEMKLRHTKKAEPQLIRYINLVAQLFPQPEWKVRGVEIYKYWDFVHTGMDQVEGFDPRGWQGLVCYGWRGELPLTLRHSPAAGFSL